MTEEKSVTKTGDEASDISVPPEATASKSTESKPSPKKNRTFILPLAIALLLLIGLSVGGYYGWQWWRQQDLLSLQREQKVSDLQQQLIDQNTQLNQLRDALQASKQEQESRVAEMSNELMAMQQRLQAHNKRLLSLSSADRRDWRLAEAEYLLQLANQRVVIERDTRNAEALLASADAILRDLGGIDLFPIRESITRDLVALKMTPVIDREGIFLHLSALSDQIQRLPLMPIPTIATDGNETETTEQSRENQESPDLSTAATWWEMVKKSFKNTLMSISDFIRVRHHDQMPEPLLPPDSHAYLQQNFRFLLERAQLAMLREETLIYQQSLQQARDWLTRYYALVEEKKQFDDELAVLQKINVVHALPDISDSLEQLQAYIERLHKLESVRKKNTTSDSSTNSSAEQQTTDQAAEAI